MRVLICPDSFTGTLTAAEAASAMAAGWAQVAPRDELVLRPMSDGGPGFIDAVQAGRGGGRRSIDVTGPLGSPVSASFLIDDEGTAWVESAEAAGLHLVPADQRDPTRTTAFGVGELIGAALGAAGATLSSIRPRNGRIDDSSTVRPRVVIGVGGTGTCDGGAGLLAALGATSSPPGALTRGGGSLLDLGAVDVAPAVAACTGCTIEVATDVDVPLLGPRGAARGFAPQKGATPEQVESLEVAMSHWARLLGRTPDGRTPALALGAGAGGGIGAALLRLGGRRVAGIGTVLAAAGIAELLPEVDLVVTGEGTFDWQSLRGKVVAGVAEAALAHAVPTLVLAGRVEVSRREWAPAGIAATFPAAAEPGESAVDGVARAAARAARTWSRR